MTSIFRQKKYGKTARFPIIQQSPNHLKVQFIQQSPVRDAIEYWIEHYAMGQVSSINNRIQQLKKHVYPYIGDMALSDCETRYWLQCFDRMNRTVPVSSGKLLQVCKQALKFCRVRRYAVSNFLDDLTIFDVGQKEAKRDRILTDTELGELWDSLNNTNKFLPYYSSWLKILMVFGCRSAEARLSRLDEWDLDDWQWKVPKGHSKNDAPIIRPIPEKIRPYIEKLKACNFNAGYIFGEKKEQSAVSIWGCRVWKTLNHNTPWTPHELRRTLATKLNDMGVAPHIVEQLLGHAMPGVMGIYNRSQYLPEKLDALNRWVDRLDELAKKHPFITSENKKSG